jgi:hypothetical protein
MVKNTIVICFFLCYCLSCFSKTCTDSIESNQSIETHSQENKDTIQITKVAGGYKFMQDGQVLNMVQLADMMQNNFVASEYLKKSKSTNGILTILGYGGGFLVGYPLGTAMGGGKPNWTLAAVGVGLIAIAIPIASSANKNLLKAVSTYNGSPQTSRNEKYYDMKLGINQSGLALAIRF